MNNKATEQNVKILSLMERMERPMTYHQAMLNESQLLQESTRVNVGTFLEFMTKYQIQKGLLVHLGYIQLYKTDTAYPTDDYYDKVTATRGEFTDNNRNLSRFDKWTDKMQNTEWNSPTGRKSPKSGVKAMGNKLYPYVIKLTDYMLNWQTAETYNAKSSEAFAKLNAAKNAMDDATKASIGLRSHGNADNPDKAAYHVFGDLGAYDVATFGKKDAEGNFKPEQQWYRKDVDDENSKVPFDRTAIRNFMGNTKAQKPYYFGVDDEGNIDPIPKSLGKLLHNTDTMRYVGGITDEEQKRLANEFIQIEKNVNSANKTFLMQNVAFICGFASAPGMDGESVYWINENPLFLLPKEKTVNKEKISFKYLYDNINPEQLKNLLATYAKSEADEMEAKGNPNVAGSTMYADDSME